MTEIFLGKDPPLQARYVSVRRGRALCIEVNLETRKVLVFSGLDADPEKQAQAFASGSRNRGFVDTPDIPAPIADDLRKVAAEIEAEWAAGDVQ